MIPPGKDELFKQILPFYLRNPLVSNLRWWKRHRHPLMFGLQGYTAAQPALGKPGSRDPFKHVVFHAIHFRQPIQPRLVNINVAGGALARPSTITQDPFQTVIGRNLHERLARSGFYNLLTII
ncbi:hypothetical protein SAMN05216589_2198 [Halopseudomonas bauzanensis]|uniref:Uncharacterized protein n=1 Tax=Halopseudomonas bauzanensis TaxID=653930 RepID=A0A1H9U908_9GAMM|nr:hypothetical protein SAMN05216589_2198 [Halopseudomonas bauzanensis]SFM06163.1 hypothetical protein SAMN04487855_2197 [Halopseudomonas bauzanensis]